MDYSSFPWTHPNLFVQILLWTDSGTILNSRAVCQSWRNWFKKNSIWKKYLALMHSRLLEKCVNSDLPEALRKLTEYRVNRLMKLKNSSDSDPTTSELRYLSLAVKLDKCLRQLEQSLIPRASADTHRYITQLIKELDEKKDIKSIGPVSLFIRIKVNHPLVVRIVTEILNKYLTSIIVDKAEKDNQKLQIFVMRAMATGQNWVFRYFEPDQDPQFAHAEIYASEEEARRATMKAEQRVNPALSSPSSSTMSDTASCSRSTESHLTTESSSSSTETISNSTEEDANQKLKRKRTEEEDDETVKKQKVEECDDTNETEDSIYSSNVKITNPNFPTILELLDIDHPVVEEALVSKFNIDRILVVPRLEEFILHQEKYADLVQGGLEIIGRDQDGNVSKINPEKDFYVTDSAVVGYIDNIVSIEVAKNQMIFWGGRDIRNRWGEFSKQLDQAGESSSEHKKSKKMSMPMFHSNPSSSDTALKSMDSIEALLAARGISITKR